jgi:outer membrane protein assembly factor BamB
MAQTCRFLPLALLLLVCGLVGPAAAQSPMGSQIVMETTARRHGLTRAWVSQVEFDRRADHLTYVTQDAGQLLVQTQMAMVHVLDAETGRTVWFQQVGHRNLLSLPPAANEKYVAIVNGTTLYLVNRPNGRREWDVKIDGAPGSGPALNEDYVFVPMVNGLMEGFEIDNPKSSTPWVYRSLGRVLVQPLLTNDMLAWTTNKGYFYVVDASKREIRFRVETRGSIESQPAYWTPNVYACSTDGYVYCVEEPKGKISWTYPAGETIVEPPVAIKDHVYVVPRNDQMICLDAATGKPKWTAAGITQFVSQSASKVYACDRFGQLTVLDINRGTRLDSMPLPIGTKKLINYRSDRIYLTTETGLIQCLHEVELKKPLLYEPPKATTTDTRKADAERKVKEKHAAGAAENDVQKKSAKQDKAGKQEAEPPAEDDPFNTK